MKPEICRQLARLGAHPAADDDAPAAQYLQATTFPHPLYPKSYADELFGLDEFYSRHQSLYASRPAEFYAALRQHFFSAHERPYGQDFFRHHPFTPFTAGTADFGELDGLVTEEEIRAAIPGAGSPPEFLCICYSYGFPDQYFISLHDPDPHNPTVYGTDHEVFFQEITVVGRLEEFFGRYLTPEEFLTLARRYFDQQARP